MKLDDGVVKECGIGSSPIELELERASDVRPRLNAFEVDGNRIGHCERVRVRVRGS